MTDQLSQRNGHSYSKIGEIVRPTTAGYLPVWVLKDLKAGR